jgi:hypothetical protein
MDTRTLRREFALGLLQGLRVVWPILSALLGLIVALGLVIGMIEGWSVHESIYFAFVSGLTIGLRDLAPKSLLTRDAGGADRDLRCVGDRAGSCGCGEGVDGGD